MSYDEHLISQAGGDGEPDYEIKSGGGDLFHPGLSFDHGKRLCQMLRGELAKGSYQMVGDSMPYETQAARIADSLTSAGYEHAPTLLALVREQAAKLDAVRAELHHAEDNGHILSGDCQGVGPGGRIPAVRVSYILDALGES